MYPKHYIDLFRSFDRNPEVFVAMPFSKQFESRWKLIYSPAINNCSLKPYRTKEECVSDSITINILDGIGRAMFLLFDISDDEYNRPNPNVMYELGIAHAIRLPEETIIVRDKKSKSNPFDISHIRWNKIDADNIKASKTKIEKLIKNASKQIDLTKDIIFKNVLSSLDIEMIAFLNDVRDFVDKGFDLFPFDLERKGRYELYNKECSEEYLRKIARQHISLNIIKPAKPIPIQDRIYGSTPEYYFTELGKILLSKIQGVWRK